MLKILQARLQQHMNRELPDVQAGFRKGRGIRDQIANIHWIIKKARKALSKPLTVWITINCGQFWKRKNEGLTTDKWDFREFHEELINMEQTA